MAKPQRIEITVVITRDDGPPQSATDVAEAIATELELFTFEADGRDDGEVTVYQIESASATFAAGVPARF